MTTAKTNVAADGVGDDEQPLERLEKYRVVPSVSDVGEGSSDEMSWSAAAGWVAEVGDETTR